MTGTVVSCFCPWSRQNIMLVRWISVRPPVESAACTSGPTTTLHFGHSSLNRAEQHSLHGQMQCPTPLECVPVAD